MANAALAYKCVEVAYMKAAFFRSPGVIKDRHALHAASLMVAPGFFFTHALAHVSEFKCSDPLGLLQPILFEECPLGWVCLL
jgi:hypothetical protein